MSGVIDALKAGALTSAVVASQAIGPVAEAANVDPAVSEPVAGLVEAVRDMAEEHVTAERTHDEMMSGQPPEDAEYADHRDPPDPSVVEATLDAYAFDVAEDGYEGVESVDGYEGVEDRDGYESADAVDGYSEWLADASEPATGGAEGYVQ